MNIPIKQAMILAAGKGTRMLPLTNTLPKPLVKLYGVPLIEHQINNLIKAGITELVINVMHHKEQIMQAVGNGDKYKVNIQYSVENILLGTGGGIVKALPFFRSDRFVVASADIYTDFNFAKFNKPANNISNLAHIILSANPEFKSTGDFVLNNGVVSNIDQDQTNFSLTYASMGVYHADFFQGAPNGAFCLGAWLKRQVCTNKITGEIYAGIWHNIGTLEQLQKLES